MGTIKLSTADLKEAEEWIKSVVKDNGTYFDTCELDGGTRRESMRSEEHTSELQSR